MAEITGAKTNTKKRTHENRPEKQFELPCDPYTEMHCRRLVQEFRYKYGRRFESAADHSMAENQPTPRYNYFTRALVPVVTFFLRVSPRAFCMLLLHFTLAIDSCSRFFLPVSC